MIRQGLTDGWRTARSFWALAVVLYMGNLSISAGIAWAVAWLLDAASGSSLAVGVLTEGYNYTVISDLRQEGFDYGRTAMGAFLVAAPLSVLLNTLLSGGIIATVLRQASGLKVWNFVAAAVAYAGRFLRLLLLGLLLLLGVAGGVALLLVVLVPAAGWGPVTEKGVVAIAAAGAFMVLFGGTVVWTAVEYARLWVVRDSISSARRALLKGLRLVGTHPLATMTLQLTSVALVAGSVMIQLLLGAPLRMESVGGILAVAALHQGAVLARSFVRLWLIGSQSSVLNAVSPAGDGTG